RPRSHGSWAQRDLRPGRCRGLWEVPALAVREREDPRLGGRLDPAAHRGERLRRERHGHRAGRRGFPPAGAAVPARLPQRCRADGRPGWRDRDECFRRRGVRRVAARRARARAEPREHEPRGRVRGTVDLAYVHLAPGTRFRIGNSLILTTSLLTTLSSSVDVKPFDYAFALGLELAR